MGFRRSTPFAFLVSRVVSEYFPVRLLDRYLFTEFIKMFLGTLVLLTVMILVYEITTHMKYFVENPESARYANLYILFSIPSMILQVISPSLMFSVCFVVGQFSVSKELVSIMVAGVSFLRIVSPILAFGFVIWILTVFASQFLVIPATKIAHKYQSYMIKGAGRITDLVYQFHVKGKEGFYYVYWYDERESSIKGGFNYIKIDPTGYPEYLVSADRAIFRADTKDWLLQKVEEIQFGERLQVAKMIREEEKVYEFPETIEYFSKPVRNPESLNFWELGEEIEIRKNKGIPYLDLRVQRHALFAMPFMSFVVVVIGSLAGALTQRSAGVASLGITIGVVLLYYILYSTGKSLGESGGIPPWIAIWYTPGAFMMGSYILYRRMNL